MSSIAEIKAQMKGLSVQEMITNVVAPKEESDEEKEPVPWTLEALKDDYSVDNILNTLNDEDNYTYNTKKSQKALRQLFEIKCQIAEDEYLERS